MSSASAPVTVKNTFIHVEGDPDDEEFLRAHSDDPLYKTESDPTGMAQTLPARVKRSPLAAQSIAEEKAEAVEDEEDDDDTPLARTETFRHTAGDQAALSALGHLASRAPVAAKAYTLAPSSGDAGDFRVKNTFVHIDEKSELMRTMSNEPEDDSPLNRTWSDPTAGMRYPLYNRPKSLFVAGESSVAPVREEPAEQDEEDEDEDEEEDDDDEVDDDDDAGGLWRTVTADPSSPAGGGGVPGYTPGAALLPNALPAVGGYPSPWAYPQVPNGMMPYMCPPPGWGWPSGAAAIPGAATDRALPPFGTQHRFHVETRSFGAVTPDFRQFTKGDYEGRLSVVSEAEVHRDCTQRYLLQFSAGELTKADSVGFVFASRLPCAKNIQRICSVFVNQRGQICLRLFNDVIRASKHIRPLAIGDWIEMAIDLQEHTASFNVWPCGCDGWPAPGPPDSSAEFHFGKKMNKAKATRDREKPIKLNVGHFACVIQNIGVTVTLMS